MKTRFLLGAVLLSACSGEIESLRDSQPRNPTSTQDSADASVPRVENDSGQPVEMPFDAGVKPEDAGRPEPMAVDAGLPMSGKDAGTLGDGMFTVGPQFQADPDTQVQNGIPKGKVYRFSMRSQDSVIYPGKTGAYTRAVALYIPKQYVEGSAAALLVVQDGKYYVDDLSTTLDNLIAKKKVPVIVTVFVDSGGGDGPGSERGLEYDRLSGDYARFIETEVLPFVLSQGAVKADHPNLKLTSDPAARAALGCSSGGSAAFTMGWFHPEWYQILITYSGTFVNQNPEPAYPLSAWQYHNSPKFSEGLIAKTALKPLRVFLHVGENDLNLNSQVKDTHHSWPEANQGMYKVLSEKGNHVRFVFAKGSGHCEGKVYDQTFPQTLEWAFRGVSVQ